MCNVQVNVQMPPPPLHVQKNKIISAKKSKKQPKYVKKINWLIDVAKYAYTRQVFKFL